LCNFTIKTDLKKAKRSDSVLKSLLFAKVDDIAVGASTVKKWHRAYKSGDFDALLPQGRKDEGISRKLDPDLQTQIRFMKSSIKSFATGFSRDLAAVENSVASGLSNGFVEGTNSKLKMVKRTMYGHCTL